MLDINLFRVEKGGNPVRSREGSDSCGTVALCRLASDSCTHSLCRRLAGCKEYAARSGSAPDWLSGESQIACKSPEVANSQSCSHPALISVSFCRTSSASPSAAVTPSRRWSTRSSGLMSCGVTVRRGWPEGHADACCR